MCEMVFEILSHFLKPEGEFLRKIGNSVCTALWCCGGYFRGLQKGDMPPPPRPFHMWCHIFLIAELSLDYYVSFLDLTKALPPEGFPCQRIFTAQRAKSFRKKNAKNDREMWFLISPPMDPLKKHWLQDPEQG